MKFICLFITVNLVYFTNAQHSKTVFIQQDKNDEYINLLKKKIYYPPDAIDLRQAGIYFVYARINKSGFIDSVLIFPNIKNALSDALAKTAETKSIRWPKDKPHYLIVPVLCIMKIAVKDEVSIKMDLSSEYYQSLEKLKFPNELPYTLLNPLLNVGFYRASKAYKYSFKNL